MKKIIAVILTVIMLLSLASCGKGEQPPEVNASTSEPTAGPLAGEYVEILKSGCYQYSYIVPYEGMEMTTTEAAKDGASVYRVALGEAGSRIIQLDGVYFAIDDKTGEMVETTAEKNLGGDLDFSAMALKGSETKDGLVFETYSMLRNGQPREFTFVFDNGALIGLAFSYVEDDAPYFAVTEFTGEVDEALFEISEADPKPLTVENASIELEFNGFSGTIVYTGAVDENGLPHGQGAGDMEADSNGDSWTYEGMWERGHFCGQGELTSHTQNYIQRGEFKNDVLNGYGSQTQDGVLRYEGQWLDGDMHGQGMLYTKAGDLLYGGMFEYSLLSETQAVRDVRVAPFKELCEPMDTAFYASWKDGRDVLSCQLSVRGSIAAMSEQNETGTVLICMNDDPDYIVALTYRYSVDEPKITAEDGSISAFGYCVGTFEYAMDGAPTFCPQIEVVYWTTE